MGKIYEYETEIGTFDVLFADKGKRMWGKSYCVLLNINDKHIWLGNNTFTGKVFSDEGILMALAMGYDLSTPEGIKMAIKEKKQVLEKYEQLYEKCDGNWDLMVAELKGMVAELKGEDPEEYAKKLEREKEKEAAEEEKQAADSYKHTVKDRLDSLSDSIEDGEEVISVIFGAEDKKEDGKKTDFWGGVFNEGILIATDRKVIYATRHTTTDLIRADEFIYASIKGVQKKKSSGGFITVKIISVDDQVYGLRFKRGDEEVLSKAAQIFVSHVNKMIRGGGAPQVAPAGDDIPTQIKKLAELKDAGILSDEEFEDKKKELLAKI